MLREIDYKEVGARIEKKRKERSLTQAQLAKRGPFDLSTLNQVELGKSKPSDKYLERLAKVLEASIEYFLYGVDQLLVGFGLTHQVAPLFLLAQDDQIPDGFKFSYYADKNDEPVPVSPNGSKIDTEQVLQYLAAPWLVDGVGKRKLDLAFVPRGTYKFKVDEVMSLFSIMNTAKGGLSILVCANSSKLIHKDTQKTKDTTQIVNEIRQPNKNWNITVSFLKETISEDLVNEIFLFPEFNSTFTPEALESHILLPALLNSIEEKILNSLKVASQDYVLFVGWEPHISLIKQRIDTSGAYKAIIADQSDFSIREEPFFHVIIDCIIRKDRFHEFRNSEQIKGFIQTIRESIRMINELKSYRGAHYKIRSLAKRLLLEDSADELYKVLHKTNFQFSTDIM